MSDSLPLTPARADQPTEIIGEPARRLALKPLHASLLAELPSVIAARVPADQKGATKAEAQDYFLEAIECCRGATDMEITSLIARLQVHYPHRELPDDAEAARWDDWLSDFAATPPDVIASACAHWRRSTAQWMPTPGQLLAITAPTVEVRKILRDRAERLISLLGG